MVNVKTPVAHHPGCIGQTVSARSRRVTPFQELGSAFLSIVLHLFFDTSLLALILVCQKILKQTAVLTKADTNEWDWRASQWLLRIIFVVALALIALVDLVRQLVLAYHELSRIV
jgi:hypothetical protein